MGDDEKSNDQQGDKDSGGQQPAKKKPWEDWGTDKEVKGGKKPGEEQR
jgi:hypothetical protein